MAKMGNSEILEKIFAISRRLLLVKMDGLNPIPRKGTTRRECYRALFEIQELLRASGRLCEGQASAIYPLTIVRDRYGGAYSGGYFTAWNCDFMEVPEEIELDDLTCYVIWDEIREGRFSRKNGFGKPIKVGVGNTPQEAIENLRSQIQAAKMEGEA